MEQRETSFERLRPLWVAVFVDILGFSIIIPFLPFFIQEYNSTAIMIGLLISSNAIFGFFFGPIWGKLSDVFGRKPTLIAAQIGTMAGFLVLSFSNSIQLLFLARIIDGIFGGQFPIAKATIGDVVPPQERSRQMTNIGVAFTLASLIGPSMGAFLSQFGVMGPGLLSTGLSLFVLIYTITFFNETLPLKTKITEPWHQIDTASKAISDSLRKNHQAMYLLYQYGFAIIAVTIFQSSLSLFGFLRLGLNQAQIGILYTIMGIFQVIFRVFVFNRIRQALGDTMTAFLGLGGFIFAFFSLAFVQEYWHLIIVLMMTSFSGACSRGILMGFTSRVVDHRNQGKINGITTALDNVAQIMGPLIGSFLLSLPTEYFFSAVLSGLSIIPFMMAFHIKSFNFDKSHRKTNQTEFQNMVKNDPIEEMEK